jgi:hypothetical protein
MTERTPNIEGYNPVEICKTILLETLDEILKIEGITGFKVQEVAKMIDFSGINFSFAGGGLSKNKHVENKVRIKKEIKRIITAKISKIKKEYPHQQAEDLINRLNGVQPTLIVDILRNKTALQFLGNSSKLN